MENVQVNAKVILLNSSIDDSKMLCAISGETPQYPVASTKTGTIYEKALIEKYISENGRDPITNEQLSPDDLIELKTERTVRPRPPTLTSIPALLSVFQNEWDALALESFNLQQQLQQTRQELSTALYQNDAAVRVIARLTKERDEARETLSKIGVSAGGASNGDSMQVDQQPLSEALIETIETTQAKLSKTRRKRAVPDGWATEEEISRLKVSKSPVSKVKGRSSIAIDTEGHTAVVDGENGQAYSMSLSTGVPDHSYNVDGATTDVAWVGANIALASSSGEVKIYDEKKSESVFTQHAGKATALAAHPSGEILASVGVDKSIVLYDISQSKVATQIFTNSSLTTAAFHPDGNLFAAGATDGQIKIYDVKSGSSAADFDTPGVVTSLAFSENGTWLASTSRGQTSIQIWDLRKMQEIKTLEVGSAVNDVAWDYTGQFLAAAGPTGITVFQYSKSSKDWSEPLKAAVPAVSLAWGQNAQSIISLGIDGTVSKLS